MALRDVETAKPTPEWRWNGDVLEQKIEIITSVRDGIVEIGHRPPRYVWKPVREIDLGE